MCDMIVRRSSKGCQRGIMGSFVFHDKPFTSKLSEQNDYPEVVKIPKGCHRVVIVC